jgi:hypothetical protein
MKTKTFLLLCLIMGFGLTTLSAQTLQKGAVLGFHNVTFTPNPDVTMNQCLDFFKDKLAPAYEKNFPGMKTFVLKGIRGECVDCISFLIVFPSDDVRNKYWKEEGAFTELGNAANEKMSPVNEEMAKYGKMVDKYTDWVIQ